MPRSHSTLPEPDDDSLPNNPIPDLTYDTVQDLVMEPDYVMVSFGYANLRSADFDIHNVSVMTNRKLSLNNEFYRRFNHLYAGKYSSASASGGLSGYHAKIIPGGPETVEQFQAFLHDMVPLWSHASISFCWSNHAYPRVNTLIYELQDNKPPHPETEQFANETGIRKEPSEFTDEEIETHVEYQNAHDDYTDSPENPRFEYGPSLILNGDYGAGGADITAYGIDTLGMDFRFETSNDGRHSGTQLFPTTSWTPDYDEIVEFLPDYPDSLEVTELTLPWNGVCESDTPQPLNPDPDNYTA